MVEKLKKTPKMVTKFVTFMNCNGYYLLPREIHIHGERQFIHTSTARILSDREVVSFLVEFCEGAGYRIGLLPEEKGEWACSLVFYIGGVYNVIILREKEGEIKFFKSRPEAIEEALLEIFKLEETKLK